MNPIEVLFAFLEQSLSSSNYWDVRRFFREAEFIAQALKAEPPVNMDLSAEAKARLTCPLFSYQRFLETGVG